jgi:hypothetical protein
MLYKFFVSAIAFLTVLGLAAGASAQTAQSAQVEQKVRNLSKQVFAWEDSVEAAPGERLEFQVIVTWNGPQAATTDVLLRATLGKGLTYAGNLKLNGSPVSGNVTTENLNIGTLSLGQSKNVTFEATVASEEQFAAGSSNIVNTATVFNTQGGGSTTTVVQVAKGTSPTDVSTGALSMAAVALAIMLILLFMASYIFFLRYYFIHNVLYSDYETRTDRKLAETILRIKRQERR